MENYRPIKGFEGLYEISDCGKVLSLKRNIIMKHSRASGYESVKLSKGNKNFYFRIHTLVGNAFLQIPKKTDVKMCFNHKDGNRFNNHVSNLEYVSYSDNTLHKFHVLKYKKVNTSNKPIKVLKCDKNGKILAQFDSLTDAAKSLNVTRTAIKDYLNKKYQNKDFNFKIA